MWLEVLYVPLGAFEVQLFLPPALGQPFMMYSRTMRRTLCRNSLLFNLYIDLFFATVGGGVHAGSVRLHFPTSVRYRKRYCCGVMNCCPPFRLTGMGPTGSCLSRYLMDDDPCKVRMLPPLLLLLKIQIIHILIE